MPRGEDSLDLVVGDMQRLSNDGGGGARVRQWTQEQLPAREPRANLRKHIEAFAKTLSDREATLKLSKTERRRAVLNCNRKDECERAYAPRTMVRAAVALESEKAKHARACVRVRACACVCQCVRVCVCVRACPLLEHVDRVDGGGEADDGHLRLVRLFNRKPRMSRSGGEGWS
eukprot:1648128-Pleurochrysis_carterae.AAC.3